MMNIIIMKISNNSQPSFPNLHMYTCIKFKFRRLLQFFTSIFGRNQPLKPDNMLP